MMRILPHINQSTWTVVHVSCTFVSMMLYFVGIQLLAETSRGHYAEDRRGHTDAS